MNRKNLILAILLLCYSYPSAGQNPNNINDIAFPSKTYIMESVNNDIYIQTFLRRWRPYNDFVRFSGSAKYDLRLEKKASLSKSSTGDVIRIDLINSDEFKTIKSLESVVCVGKPSVGDNQVVVQFLGDSYTQGNYFKFAMLESGYVPNVKLVGTRVVNGHPGQYHEGRGGWTLKRYFSDNPTDQYSYNPYWQPNGKYHYWGNTAFWKNCILVQNDSSIKEFNLKYFCSGYDLSAYGSDGRRVAPVENDVMWDSDTKRYIVWQNKKWREIKPDELEWSFDYGKYIEMHRLAKPEFLVVMLGLNDFRNGKMDADFSQWNLMTEQLLKSYKAAVPEGRLVLCTPCTSCGTLDNQSGDFTTLKNAIMWEVRKNIIDTFDKREQEGIYVVDASATIDNEAGYNIKDGIQTGNPHPYPNYPKLGVPVAAFIQFCRTK